MKLRYVKLTNIISYVLEWQATQGKGIVTRYPQGTELFTCLGKCGFLLNIVN